MTVLRKAAAVFASALAALVVTAGPAQASDGWVYHSSYEGNIFFDDQCGEAGAALKAQGEVQGYRCIVNDETGLWDLYVITGTWIYHSRYGDVFDCAYAGQDLVNAGIADITDCVLVKTPTWYFDLYYI